MRNSNTRFVYVRIDSFSGELLPQKRSCENPFLRLQAIMLFVLNKS